MLTKCQLQNRLHRHSRNLFLPGAINETHELEIDTDTFNAKALLRFCARVLSPRKTRYSTAFRGQRPLIA